MMTLSKDEGAYAMLLVPMVNAYSDFNKPKNSLDLSLARSLEEKTWNRFTPRSRSDLSSHFRSRSVGTIIAVRLGSERKIEIAN